MTTSLIMSLLCLVTRVASARLPTPADQPTTATAAQNELVAINGVGRGYYLQCRENFKHTPAECLEDARKIQEKYKTIWPISAKDVDAKQLQALNGVGTGYFLACRKNLSHTASECLEQARERQEIWKGWFPIGLNEAENKQIALLNGFGEGYYYRCRKDLKSAAAECIKGAREAQDQWKGNFGPVDLKDADQKQMQALNGVGTGYYYACRRKLETSASECIDGAREMEGKWKQMFPLTDKSSASLGTESDAAH